MYSTIRHDNIGVACVKGRSLENSVTPILIFIAGFIVGSNFGVDFSPSCHHTSTSSSDDDAFASNHTTTTTSSLSQNYDVYAVADTTVNNVRWFINVLVAMYSLLVFVILVIVTISRSRRYFWSTNDSIVKRKRTRDRRKDQSLIQKKKLNKEINYNEKNDAVLTISGRTTTTTFDEKENEPSDPSTLKIDLNGAFKLERNINFQEFLECQGVGWALRKAADKAITTHHITHEDKMLKIRVAGIISSETTFTIDGPPMTTKVKDRVYKDYVSYAENGMAIQVMKINEKYNYKIRVLRKFTDKTREMLEVRSTAYFEKTGKEVEAIQYYRRLRPGEK